MQDICCESEPSGHDAKPRLIASLWLRYLDGVLCGNSVCSICKHYAASR